MKLPTYPTALLSACVRAAVRWLGPVAAGRSIDPETYNWSSKRLVIDFNAEYFLNKRLTLLSAFSNILDDPVDNKIYGPNIPQLAKFLQRQNYGSLWTFGLKNVF